MEKKCVHCNIVVKANIWTTGKQRINMYTWVYHRATYYDGMTSDIILC